MKMTTSLKIFLIVTGSTMGLIIGFAVTDIISWILGGPSLMQ